MARPVDAEALEKKISEWLGQPGNGDYYSGYDAALCAVQDLIADTPTITPPNEWVSAKDNPPQLTGKYICCVEDTHGHMWSIPADYLLEMKTWVGEFGEIKNIVTHWMPLPKSPAPPDSRPPEGGTDA